MITRTTPISMIASVDPPRDTASGIGVGVEA